MIRGYAQGVRPGGTPRGYNSYLGLRKNQKVENPCSGLFKNWLHFNVVNDINNFFHFSSYI
jgi:hypothetical protein